MPRTRDTIYVVVRVMFAVLAVYSVVEADYEAAAIAMIGFVLSIVPQLIVRRLRLKLPLIYELVVLGFIVASIMMGELFDAYGWFTWWDSMLHLSSGVIIGYIGYMILFTLYHQGKLQLSAGLIAFLTFSVSMMVAATWEVFEFGVDEILGGTMQYDNTDTMIDITLAMIGSLVATVAAYWHHRWPETSPLSGQLGDFMRRNRHLLPKKRPSAGK